MREIKFRAWDTFEKTMLTVEQINVDAGEVYTEGDMNSLYFRQEPEESEPNCILMQFTGLHDKNENEIYEGDVVTCDIPLGIGRLFEKVTGEVTYCDNVAAFGVRIPWENNGSITWEVAHYRNFEVIGNIYENPELLTQ